MTDKGNLHTIKGLIDNWFNDKQIATKRKRYGAFLEWDSLVGPNIAKNTEPLKFYDDVLVIKVRNSVWTQELQFLKPQILEKIKASFPETKIRDLIFKIGPITDRA